ncbi:carnitine O-palmitoyltransferase 2, mitochondrial-like [Gigantopelta aegis]|uniref:carnitine O-palmitoyltransferase 2, mitochondrial-like n=1 Tax=Gigantopelta aegis TaxID=1735272 RepID=UPI001B88B600|nr:carnitine O-palmitoyltransferase 2, mitochondrial-like [Gigantopelta aegis]
MWRVVSAKHQSCYCMVFASQLQIPTLSKCCSGVRLYSATSDEREYLHRSIVPTYHFQKSLPRLPIPKLEKTCERYLKAQLPLLSSAEYANTETIVKGFLQGDGTVLHEELVAKDKNNKHTSYISDLWFDMYLKDRSPVVITHNPFMVFNNDPKPEYNNQLLRATNMVVSSARFMKTLNKEILEPEVFHLNPAKSDNEKFRKFVRFLPQAISWYGAYWYKAFPLDMSQYKRLFNSTRIPRKSKDELYTDETARHLVVLRKGNFYIFDVLDSNGNIYPAEDIMSHIKYILEDSAPIPEYPVGVMTTENRDVWADVRTNLVNSGNEHLLKLIDGAMFALALDDKHLTDPNDISRSFLHSDGINRWFDKCFQLLMSDDGVACVNFEHSWGDGVAVLRYFREVFKDSTEKPQVHPTTKPSDANSSQRVQRLEFKLDGATKEAIKQAKTKFDKKTASLDLQHLEYQTFTRKKCKQQKLSPDSVLQLAIQLAYFRQTGKTVGTYESCSTAAFKHGRTETVRPCTVATKRMCDLIFNSKTPPTVEELQQGLKNCSEMHQQLTREAAMGKGFDRHLFALRHLAEDSGKALDLFEDPAYKKLNHIILSTSTLSDPSVLIGGFGAVVPDGYGIGYAVEDGRLGFNITNYPPATDINDFLKCCEHSLDDIYDIFNGRVPSKRS